jgi:hypothetical protein
VVSGVSTLSDTIATHADRFRDGDEHAAS